MAYGKGRAQGYSDYFKNNSRTPNNDDDEEMGETILPRTSNTELSPEDKRKLALRRRLQKLREEKSQ